MISFFDQFIVMVGEENILMKMKLRMPGMNMRVLSK